MSKFFRKEDGLVTIEWVGIAAVMVLAALAITAFVLEGAKGPAEEMEERISAVPEFTIGGGGSGGGDDDGG